MKLLVTETNTNETTKEESNETSEKTRTTSEERETNESEVAEDKETERGGVKLMVKMWKMRQLNLMNQRLQRSRLVA